MKKNLSITEIRQQLLMVKQVDDEFLIECSKDERKGVQQLVKKWNKEFEQKQKLEEKWLQMNQYENKAYQQGYRYIVGIDEVGRGPLAGPVVAAAVILPRDFKLLGLDDSKKISEKKREMLFDIIIEKALAYKYSEAEMKIINRNRKRMIIGTPDEVREQIINLSKLYSTEEFMIINLNTNLEDKIKSYRLISEAFKK